MKYKVVITEVENFLPINILVLSQIWFLLQKLLLEDTHQEDVYLLKKLQIPWVLGVTALHLRGPL